MREKRHLLRPLPKTTHAARLLPLVGLLSLLGGGCHCATVPDIPPPPPDHPSLVNLWYSSPNETRIPTFVKEYGSWAYNRTWSAVNTATYYIPGSHAAATVATSLLKPIEIAEDVVAYMAMETFDVMVDGSQWLLRTGNYTRRARVASCAKSSQVIIADQSRRLVADLLRHELARKSPLGSRRTMPAPLQKLLSRTLSPRKREGRPHLFEHLCGLGTSMGLALWLLRHHPVYLVLSMATSVYYAWTLQMAYDGVVRERINSLLEETLQTQDQFNTYESAMWFNNILAEGWNTTLGPQLNAIIEKQLDTALKMSILPNISRLEVSEFKFGTKPPRIQYIRLLNTSSLLSSGYGLAENLGPTVAEDKSFVLLELGLGFVSEGSMMKASFEPGRRTLASIIPLPKKRLPSLLSLSDISVQATLLLLIQFLPHPPFIRVSRWCFADKPDVRFSLRPLSSLDVTALPVLSQALEYWINRSLQPIVNPNYVQASPPPNLDDY